MDTILVLDTSGSMAGSRLTELKKAVISFIDLIEELGLGDRISIVQFGGRTGVVCGLTSNYRSLRQHVDALRATGSTPMTEGLALGFEQLVKFARPLRLGRQILMPRVLLMTDGEPDSKETVLKVAAQLGQLKFPVSCVGVDSCDQRVMGQIAALSGGMFVLAEDMNLLQLFFIRQVLLIVYIQKMADDIQNLLNRELLRAFLEKQTNSTVSDAELDGFITLMSHLVTTGDDDDDGPRIEDVRETDSGCCGRRCCNCSCSCRGVFTVLLWLVQLALIGTSIYTAVWIARGGHDVEKEINLFAISAICIAMILNCGCMCHMSYLRIADSDSVAWIVEFIAVLFLAVPQGLMFATALGAPTTFLFPAAITAMSVVGTCFCCLCVVWCCEK